MLVLVFVLNLGEDFGMLRYKGTNPVKKKLIHDKIRTEKAIAEEQYKELQKENKALWKRNAKIGKTHCRIGEYKEPLFNMNMG